MKIVATTDELNTFCAHAREFPFIAVDTEFVRDTTYFPRLCLIQMALPDTGEWSEIVVDVISGGPNLDGLYEIFRDPSITKVFHAARQDLEIFFLDRGEFPAPLFDTQVAAMAYGFGENVGYRVLVQKFANTIIDKGPQFSRWDKRPLSARQLSYALADVTHLRTVYLALSEYLARSGRERWLADELTTLTSPETYKIDPRKAWRRLNIRGNSPRNMAIVREIAQFREEQARANDVPRNRVLTDDAIFKIAAIKPTVQADLRQIQPLLHFVRRTGLVNRLICVVRRGVECPESDLPEVPRIGTANPNVYLVQLLKVLLRARANKHKVAHRLIASADEIGAIAAGEARCRVLQGWRGEVFGRDALQVCQGKMALRFTGSSIEAITVQPE